jgi:hypothetical protein
MQGMSADPGQRNGEEKGLISDRETPSINEKEGKWFRLNPFPFVTWNPFPEPISGTHFQNPFPEPISGTHSRTFPNPLRVFKFGAVLL